MNNSDPIKNWEHGPGAPGRIGNFCISENTRRVTHTRHEKGKENYDTLNKSVPMVQVDTPY